MNVDGIIPAPGAYPCINPRCSSVVERPGICDPCGDARAKAAEAKRIAERVRREIPLELQWSTWSNPELAERCVTNVARAREAIEARGSAVIIGAAGLGKTSLAVAWLRERLEAGEERARFVEAYNLAEPSYIEGLSRLDLALCASSLVLDDLGKELAGAPSDSGVAAQRVAIVHKIIRARHSQGLKTVVTTGYDQAGIARIYGDDIARRLFERAAVVRLKK